MHTDREDRFNPSASDLPVEGDDLDDGGEIEDEAESENEEEDDEDRPRRRRRRRKHAEPEPEFDPVRFQKRLAWLGQQEKFRAWLKQHYPAIQHRTELTPEIVDQFDDYDMASARERAAHPSESRDHEVVDFSEMAFNYADPLYDDFRQWAANKYRIHHKEDVTRAIMVDWHEYYDARVRAHNAKDEIDIYNKDYEEWEAGADEWGLEGHPDLTFLPNTKVEWAALLKRRADRIAREKAEAERKATKERAAATDRQRKRTLVAKLKQYKLPAMEAPVPNLTVIGGAREEHDKAIQELLQAWRARFNDLPDVVRTAWRAYHDIDEASFNSGEELYLTPHDGAHIGAADADDVLAGLRDRAFEKFRRFNEGVRQAIKRLDDDLERLLNPPADAYVPHQGYTLDEIEDEDERYVLANVIPEGLAVMYGAPKAGKSSWAQKLSACVSGDAVPFDGAEVAHGRVLYVSCDPGARKGAVKRRMMEIFARLELPSNRNMVIVEDPVILNDPASIASLLERNPGKYALVVIDPLYQCVTGSLLQDAVMMEAIKGLGTISRATGAAVLLIHHEPRGSAHLFGSMLLDAALDARIHVERDKDIVTVKVELLKNGEPPKRPFVYRIEGAYLSPATVPPRAKRGPDETTSTGGTAYSDMLALLPDKPIRETEARKLVEHLLSAKSTDAQRQQWHRALKAMAKAGLVTRRGGTVQRRPAP